MPIGEITPPASHPEDEPLVCVSLNEGWIPYLIGALRPMKYPEYWAGTLEENRQARRDTENLIFQLENFVECGGDILPVNYCCIERLVEHRINPITLQLEISIDGGTTWTTDPSSPIAQLVAQPPPVTAGVMDDKCDAATNGQQHIEDMIAAVSTNLETALTVGELAIAVCEAILAIILFVASAGALATLAVALASAIWAAFTGLMTLGKEAFDAYWTSVERDKILCHIYCNIGDDGSFTQALYDKFLSDWKNDATPSVAFNAVFSAVKAVGLKGMNNMCAYGAVGDADCSDCDCESCGALWDIWQGGSILDTGIHPPGTFILGGTVNVSGGTWFDIASVPSENPPPANFVTMKSPSPTDCCAIYYETLTGSISNFFIINCGDAQDPGNWNFSVLQGSNGNALELASTVSFTARVTFLGAG